MKFKNLLKPFIALSMYALRILPIKKNKIAFCAFSGRVYGDNPKAIAECLVDKFGGNVDCVFFVQNPSRTIVKKGIRLVKYNTFRYLYEMATAHVWIDNTRKQPQVKKRKGQFYIQTWHGGIWIKKIEADVADSLDSEYIRTAINDSKNIDILLTNSEWGVEQLKRCFWYEGDILKTGSPRLDVIFKYLTVMNYSLKNSLGIKQQQKVALYAPTFRRVNSFEVYNLDIESLIETLRQKFGGEWVILVKMHPNIKDAGYKCPSSAHDVSQYPDINELYTVSDILITDYSSSIFDFMITMRPAFLFAIDAVEYSKDRDTYFDLHKLPFLFAENNNELMDNIRSFDYDVYKEKLSKFIDSLGILEDGHASERVVNIIQKFIE